MALRACGETAKSWDGILAFYDGLQQADPIFSDIAKLANAIGRSPFRDAGLCATTSMHDLILGPSTHVLGNPYLVIHPDFDRRTFELTYQDGSAQPWTSTVSPEEAFDAVSRFLTKRARWYKTTS